MALASRQFWSNKNTRPNFNKNNSSGAKGKQRVRTCFNCGNVSHFVAECPYEKREDNGGKLIRKYKAKSFPNKSNFTKKTPPKGLVAQEEYNEDDDDEDGETFAMAPWPLRQLHERPSLTHPMRTSHPSASWLKRPTR